jgi:uncharacterized protein (DUF924 family)
MPSADPREVEEILAYWFGSLDAEDDIDRSKNDLWWKGGEATDADVRTRFGDLVRRALAGHLDSWAASPRGTMALVILLDQLTRNIGRGTPEAFAGDARALQLSLGAIESGADRKLRLIERQFLYMPLMHAEDREIARRSIEVFERLSRDIQERGFDDFPDSLSHARQHADIVMRFGRYPHRNVILGRSATAEEEAFLAEGGPSFGQAKKTS